MPTRYLSDAELARLSGYPETIADEDLVTYFRLTDEDRRWLRAEHRGEANRLGLALQLCTLPWLGFIPDDLTTAPSAAVRRLAEQLGVGPEVQAAYGGWEHRTRREHLRQVLRRLGWRTAGAGELKALDDFLLARALEHDRPTLLVQLACDHLRAERVVRPGVVALVRRVATARERAWEEAYERLQPLLLDPARRAQLDRLVEPDPALGAVPLVWLRRGATAPSSQAIKAELAKLDFVRSLGGDRLDLSAIPASRRRFLATLGRRSRMQPLARAAGSRRYPVLLATLAETAVEVLDELVELFDQALAGADRRARAHLAERALERAQSVEDRLDLLDELVRTALWERLFPTPPPPLAGTALPNSADRRRRRDDLPPRFGERAFHGPAADHQRLSGCGGAWGVIAAGFRRRAPLARVPGLASALLAAAPSCSPRRGRHGMKSPGAFHERVRKRTEDEHAEENARDHSEREAQRAGEEPGKNPNASC